MPVEDVDFLIKNSEKDAYLFFVDSTQRNKEVYPTVSEYEVNFTEPFAHVYGLEVLDAMIPSTRYTMDIGRDALFYHLAFLNTNAFANDQSWYELLGQLNQTKDFAKEINVDDPNINGYGNTLTVFEKGTITSVEYSATRTGFKAVELTFLEFLPNEIRENADSYDDTTEFKFSTNNGTFILNMNYSHFNTILPYINTRNIYVDIVASKLILVDIHHITLTSHHTINSTSTIAGIFNTFFYDNPNVLFTLVNVHEVLEHGNYDIYTFQSYMNTLITLRVGYVYNDSTRFMPFNDAGKSLPNILQNTKYGTVEKQSKYKFTISTVNVKFFINFTKSTVMQALGFASKTPTKGETLYYTHDTNWPNKEHYMISTYQTETDKIILSPGVVNLNGLSYVILRCPEIESHMYNSFSYSQNCPGIGMFKLGSLNQIFNVRFDFVNFIKKPFHPIGKLSKVTLRFETTDGLPYDFKGVDHHMLLSVKFYVPRLKEPQHKFHLNPNYNPNFLEYMINDMKIDEEQNDEEEEWDESLDDRRTILNRKYERLIQEQNEYDYSSEEDQDETDIMTQYS